MLPILWALCPGFIGGILAQLKDLAGQRRRFWTFLSASAIGGVIGSMPPAEHRRAGFHGVGAISDFNRLLLLAVQGLIRIWLVRRSVKAEAKPGSRDWAVSLVGLAAIYGGYFGVAMSVVVLSLLGLMINDT